ncbi:MAG TPA: class I tRNA ligase family protein, partial [Acidimicrobiia bacterium]
MRFGVTNLGERAVPAADGYPVDPGPESAWILSRLHDISSRVDALLDEYRFSEAYSVLYSFAWSEAFDWYLELSKSSLKQGSEEAKATLGVVLRDLLKLFHPVIPYVTEELWSHLVGDGFLAAASWPTPPAYDEPEHFETFRDLVVGFRRFRAEHGLSPRAPLQVTLVDPDGRASDWWFPQFEALARVSPQVGEAPEGEVFSRVVAGTAQAFISLEGLVDVDAERARLDKEIADIAAVLERSRSKL